MGRLGGGDSTDEAGSEYTVGEAYFGGGPICVDGDWYCGD